MQNDRLYINMTKKSFTISASGLKNIVFTSESCSTLFSDRYDSFKFILEDKEIFMNRIFAEFISPFVSHIHQSDPTIDSICLNDFIQKENSSNNFFSPEVIDNFKKISTGNSIEIDEAICQKLRILSILIRNQEMFDEMNKLYPLELNEKSIDQFIEFIKYFDFSSSKNYFYYQSFNNQTIINFISSNFYLIKDKLLTLPKSILYLIISNENLKLKSEDSLFDFINEIFSNEKVQDDEKEQKIYFYEELILSQLSKEKFNEFINEINSKDITQNIWEKMKECFFCFKENFESKEKGSSRYVEEINKKDSGKKIKIEYDNNTNNRFKGIISHLGDGNGKNVINKKIIKITALAYNSGLINNVVDFDDKNASFGICGRENSWIRYDFVDRKVMPSHYSIMSDHWNNSNRGYYRPQCWCIEGSNDETNWTTLDTRQNEKSLDSQSVSNTFEIKNKNNEFYRFIQIRQTGKNTGNDNDFRFSSLEYFGTILET